MAAKKIAKKTIDPAPKDDAGTTPKPASKKVAKKATKTAAKTAKKVAAKKTAASAPVTPKTAATPAPLAPPAKKAASKPSLDAIARAAYLNYRRRVEQGLPGDSHGDWLEAERQFSNPA